VGWRGPFRDKGQLKVMDDFVHHGIVGEESDDLHRPAAPDTGQGIHLVHFSDHFGPALGGDRAELLLLHPEREGLQACLPELPSMSVGVQAELC